MDRQILSLLTEPIQRDLGISLTQMGALLGLPLAVFFAVMGLPLARLADSRGRRGVIGAGIALWSIMTALCGLAGTYGKLLLARIGVGVGEASLQAPAVSLISDYFDDNDRATAQSIYATGIFLGSGLAYYIGGWIVGLVSAQEQWSVPLVGSMHPWQTVFLFVGLPGLLIAAMMWTVREPERRDHSHGTAPLSELFKWARGNAALLSTYAGGFTLSATVNYAIAAWMARWLVASFGWTITKAGTVQGVLTMTVGTISVIAGGRLGDWLSRRGVRGAPAMVGMIAASGLIVSAAGAFAVSSESAVVAWLAAVNVFAAMPWGAAQSGAAEIVPARLRSQGVAVFLLVLNLISATGPLIVGWVTDSFFNKDAAQLGNSLAIVSAAGLGAAIALLFVARGRYRATEAG